MASYPCVRFVVFFACLIFMGASAAANIVPLFRFRVHDESGFSHWTRVITVLEIRDLVTSPTDSPSGAEVVTVERENVFLFNGKCEDLKIFSRVLASTSLAAGGYGLLAVLVAFVQLFCYGVAVPMKLTLLLAFLCETTTVIIAIVWWFRGACDDGIQDMKQPGEFWNDNGGLDPLRYSFSMVEGFGLHCGAGLGYLITLFISIGA